MAENRNGSDKRFYFSRSQLVTLAVGFTITAVAIYFLGILTGKQMATTGLARNDEPRVKIPVQPLLDAPGSEPEAQAKEELAFSQTVTKSPGTQPSVEVQAKETKRADKPPKAETQEKTAPAEEPPSTASKKTPTKVSEKTPALSATPKKETKASQAAERDGPGKNWTVQISAFPEQASAGHWVSDLKTKGYEAYMVEGAIKGRTWYRVRVGRFATRKEAEALRKILASKEGLSDAFLARE